MRKAVQLIINRFDDYIKEHMIKVKQEIQSDYDVKLQNFRDEMNVNKSGCTKSTSNIGCITANDGEKDNLLSPHNTKRLQTSSKMETQYNPLNSSDISYQLGNVLATPNNQAMTQRPKHNFNLNLDQ